eukprot:7345780-Prorocentrum_lima.AAC.1
MTSSLVGSEMCIRDRMVADQKAAEVAAARRAADQALRDGEREKKLAQESSRKMQEELSLIHI